MPTRIITYAWGERYFNELLSITLPALLAPGNLPYVAAAAPCELVILTEKGVFPRVLQDRGISRIRELCKVRLIEIDDLIPSPDKYGIAPTFVLHRGLSDLVHSITDTWLMFLNADFILANGSLGNVLGHLVNGERLVAAPSYCVNAEAVVPELLERVDCHSGTLSLTPRDMAALVLRNRHNTIRAKTVNQNFVTMRYMDQFYWLIDYRTLIGYQMPVAIVGMRPERYLPEPNSFWDHGLIREFCPSAEHFVIGDSGRPVSMTPAQSYGHSSRACLPTYLRSCHPISIIRNGSITGRASSKHGKNTLRCDLEKPLSTMSWMRPPFRLAKELAVKIKERASEITRLIVYITSYEEQRASFEAQIRYLKERNSLLTEAATERARQLQEKTAELTDAYIKLATLGPESEWLRAEHSAISQLAESLERHNRLLTESATTAALKLQDCEFRLAEALAETAKLGTEDQDMRVEVALQAQHVAELEDYNRLLTESLTEATRKLQDCELRLADALAETATDYPPRCAPRPAHSSRCVRK